VISDAQLRLPAAAAAALSGHEALWAWDLGNENSNCVIPPTTAMARAWLARLTSAIRGADETALVTVGLHMEVLEEDRQLGPREVSESCDFLSMHGYPIYARWADGPTDDQLLPFLARMTCWLGEGREVLFSEFGLPSYRRGDPSERRAEGVATPLVDEDAAATYTARALEALRRAGCLGAMLWCYSDYDPALWQSPPLDLDVGDVACPLIGSERREDPVGKASQDACRLVEVEQGDADAVDVAADGVLDAVVEEQPAVLGPERRRPDPDPERVPPGACARVEHLFGSTPADEVVGAKSSVVARKTAGPAGP
jgi:hypothetical protein